MDGSEHSHCSGRNHRGEPPASTITAYEETIEEKTQAVKSAKKLRKEVFIQFAKKDKLIENLKEQIERQKAHIGRLEDNLRAKGIKMELEDTHIAQVYNPLGRMQTERQKAHIERPDDNLRMKGIKNKQLDKWLVDDTSLRGIKNK